MRSFVRCALGVCVALAAIPARAEEAGQDPARAQALFVEAKELYEAGKVRESLVKLREAHAAFPADAILLSIANRHLELGEPEEAAAALSQIQANDPKLRASVKKLKSDVQEKLEAPVPVAIRANAPEARVSIDEGPFEVLPVKRVLPRGIHRLVIQAPGYDTARIKQRVRGTMEMEIRATLIALEGSWRVKLDPEAPLGEVRIVFDGEQQTLTEAERDAPLSQPRAAKPGTYRVACHRGVDTVVRAEITIAPNAEAIATCRFPDATGGEAPPYGQIFGWSSAGAGGVSLALGIFFLASYADDLEKYPAPRYRLESSKPAAGGVLLAAGVGLGVLSALFLTDVITF